MPAASHGEVPGLRDLQQSTLSAGDMCQTVEALDPLAEGHRIAGAACDLPKTNETESALGLNDAQASPSTSPNNFTTLDRPGEQSSNRRDTLQLRDKKSTVYMNGHILAS